MLRYVTMNIFDSPAQTLVNAVNTVGVMGKGIAQDYKQRYPEMFKRYKAFCDAGTLTIGKLYLYKGPNKWVLNLPTKLHWRNPSKPEYVEAGLKKFAETYSDSGITSISFPQLGTGNGGLDWGSVVRPMMERYLDPIAIPVYVHVSRKPADFTPEHLDKVQLAGINEPRVGITFRDFLHDLSELADSVVRPPADEDEPSPLPRVQFGKFDIPGEELAALWADLAQKGALAPQDFPPTIAQHSREMTHSLLRLDYIKPINFAQGKTEIAHGIRFAPPAEDRGLRKEPTDMVAERGRSPFQAPSPR